MRRTSIVETVLTYTTFLTASVALHVVVILGNRPLETLRQYEASTAPSSAAAPTAPVAQDVVPEQPERRQRVK